MKLIDFTDEFQAALKDYIDSIVGIESMAGTGDFRNNWRSFGNYIRDYDGIPVFNPHPKANYHLNYWNFCKKQIAAYIKLRELSNNVFVATPDTLCNHSFVFIDERGWREDENAKDPRRKDKPYVHGVWEKENSHNIREWHLKVPRAPKEFDPKQYTPEQHFEIQKCVDFYLAHYQSMNEIYSEVKKKQDEWDNRPLTDSWHYTHQMI